MRSDNYDGDAEQFRAMGQKLVGLEKFVLWLRKGEYSKRLTAVLLGIVRA